MNGCPAQVSLTATGKAQTQGEEDYKDRLRGAPRALRCVPLSALRVPSSCPSVYPCTLFIQLCCTFVLFETET